MLVLLGLNYRSAPLGVRERIAFEEPDLHQALRRLASSGLVEEGLILSTCNRVEILAKTTESGGLAAVKAFLEAERGVSREEIERYAYHFEGLDAVRHLFRVASGLDSMILGEPQILGQVRRSYLAAQAAGATGPILDRVLQQGLGAAKRIRTETGISRHAVSVASTAVVLARKIFGDLEGRSVLLLGAGKMTELAAKHLRQNGIGNVIVSNRTYHGAVVLADRFGWEVVNWDDAISQIEKVDMVVTGTAAPEPILRVAEVQRAMRARRSRPLFLIDLAVPRDVEPAVHSLDNVYLYDIDDLEGVVEANLGERKREAEKAKQLIEQEVESYDRWWQSLEITPTISALRDALHDVRLRELERFRRRLEPLAPKQQQAIEELTRAIVQKILHPPIRHLKGCVETGHAAGRASLYREIFGIGEPEEEEAAGATEEESAERDEPREGPHGIIRGGREE